MSIYTDNLAEFVKILQIYQLISPENKLPSLKLKKHIRDSGNVFEFDITNNSSGSFKIFEAIKSIMNLLREGKYECTLASAGNHAAAVCAVIQSMKDLSDDDKKTLHEIIGGNFDLNKLQDFVVYPYVPENTPKTKLDRIKAAGFEPIIAGANIGEAREAIRLNPEHNKLSFLSAYLGENVLIGNMAAGKILADNILENQHLFQKSAGSAITKINIWVSVGGGGLSSGTIEALEDLQRNNKDSLDFHYHFHHDILILHKYHLEYL